MQTETTKRERRSSAEVDKERAESYLSSLPLAEKVALVKSLKAQIDAEVKSLTEAAATATGLTKEL